ncbi:hypothetical protein VTL71DRAFT_1413 [Oculimacula yallundae]|uniref:2EXR domain-containing protein n=1 Tax=Oculimacula yallundae TaxID=86028 RepID=A0ABR4CAS5_9HELO
MTNETALEEIEGVRPLRTHSPVGVGTSNGTLAMAVPGALRRSTRSKAPLSSNPKVSSSKVSPLRKVKKATPRVATSQNNASTSNQVSPVISPPVVDPTVNMSPISRYAYNAVQAMTTQMGCLPSVKVPAKFEDFTLFPKLPAEIRVKIWKLAIGHTSNIIKLDFGMEPLYETLTIARHRDESRYNLRAVTETVKKVFCKFFLSSEDAPNEALLQVCMESRVEAQKYMSTYIQLRGDRSGSDEYLLSRKIWFNPATDTIYLDKRSAFVLSTMLEGGNCLYNFNSIKSLGVHQFDIRSKGLELRLNRVFDGVLNIVPVRTTNEDTIVMFPSRSHTYFENWLAKFDMDFMIKVLIRDKPNMEEWADAACVGCERFWGTKADADVSPTWPDGKWTVSEEKLYIPEN